MESAFVIVGVYVVMFAGWMVAEPAGQIAEWVRQKLRK